MKVLLFSILLMNSVYAADCVMDDVRVPDTEKLSLFDADRSLSTHKVQDQDGLGTCYANATSAVLKSVLPGHPDVSYTQAALEASTRGVNASWLSNNQRYIRRNGNKVEDITYGGFTCRTVEALKQAGGACPANQSILENRTLSDTYVQERLMKNMGAYFDDMNAITNNPVEAQKYKDQLALIVESINSERAKLIDSCNAEKNSSAPVVDGLKRMLGLELLEAKKSPCEMQLKSTVLALLPKSTASSDRNEIVITDELKGKLEAAINSNPVLKASLEKYAAGRALPASENSRMITNLGLLLTDFLKANLGTPDVVACQNGTYAPSTPPAVLANQFAITMKKQKQMNCQTEITNANVLFAAKIADGNQCVPPARLEVILKAIAPLMEVGTAIDANILNTLSNPLSTYGNQLKQLIAPACQTPANLINMDNVSCKSYSTCQELDLGSVYNGPAGGCTTLTEAKKVLGKQMVNAIKQGRALGIDVCTAFMQNPATVSGFCKTAPAGVPGHAYHAMAVSGYRCVAGKMEYEILNSWGKESCPIARAPYKNAAIECVLDARGRPTGKWWAKEDVLIDNTTRINDVTNGTP
jgi:hypothetical protein